MKNKIELIVALENIRSLYNIGAIYRTAEFFGVKTICLIGYSGIDNREPNKIHKKIQKTSLGTINKVNTEIYANTHDMMKTHSRSLLIAIEQAKNSIPISQFTLQPKTKSAILLFGNEVNGIEKGSLNMAHKIAEIPKIGTHQSLNVTTACGIVLAYLQLGTSIKP